MAKRFLAALAAWLVLTTAALAQSTVNPSVPAVNAPLSSAPVRSNFGAAYSDINGLLNMHAVSALVNCSAQTATVGADCLVTSSPTAYLWYKYGGVHGYSLIGTIDPSQTPPTFAVASATTSIIVGTTTIAGGTSGRVLYDNAGVFGELPVTGTGSAVLGTSPTITTPAIAFGVGSSNNIFAGSANTGFTNTFYANNSGTIANAATVASIGALLPGGATIYLQASGGGSPLGTLATSVGLTGGLTITAAVGPLTLVNSATSFRIPTTNGSSGQVLSTDGAGVTSWISHAASVFGRTGAVVATSGDYSFSLISGTALVNQGGTGAVTFTANDPLIGNGTSAIAQGTRSGNTTVFATTSGSLTNGNCVSIGASGNLVDAGGPCTTGGGGGTVSAGTANQLAYYASTGTVVSGLASAANGVLVTDGGSVPSISSTLPAVTLGGTVSGGGNQLNNIIIGTSTPLAGSFTSLAYSTTLTGTSANASALAVGRQGATNPALQVDSTTASSATGIKIKSAAAAGGVAVSVITSGTNENLTIDAAGSGTITVGGTSTGAIALSRATTVPTLNGNTFTTGTYTLTGVGGKTLTFNNSITLAGTDSTTMTFPSVSATIPRTVASGAKALATGAISSATCTSVQTDTATGTLTSDAVEFTFSADPTAATGYIPSTSGMLTIIPYVTADTINFKVCNNTSASITPGAVTVNWRVVR
jgi:hypothetical protein